jgi:hypothetical protein
VTVSLRRLAGAAVAWTGSVALTAGASLALVAVGPAAAADLGTVTLSATSGSVGATPIFTSASTDKPCPSGFGADAQLRVGPPGGPYSNLARPLSAGGYDRAKVTARPNRSFSTALGGAPVDGEWWVVVECISVTAGVHTERFVTPITVSGSRWRTGRPANAPANPVRPNVPQGGGALPPTLGPSAGATAQGPAPTTAGAPAGAVPDATATVDPLLTGSQRTGSASLGGAVWLVGLLGVVIVLGAVHLMTRRRPAAAPAGRGPGPATRTGATGAKTATAAKSAKSAKSAQAAKPTKARTSPSAE